MQYHGANNQFFALSFKLNSLKYSGTIMLVLFSVWINKLTSKLSQYSPDWDTKESFLVGTFS